MKKNVFKMLGITMVMLLLLVGLTDVTQAQGPSIDIKEYINGLNIAVPPEIPVGSMVIWLYVVTNTGDTMLTEISVTDDQGISVICPATSLEPGDSMICLGIGTATEDLYTNTVTVKAIDPSNNTVTDSDTNEYLVVDGDSDGDGINDSEDQCQDSDANTVIVIEGCDTGVENVLFDTGCTMSDLIALCADNVTNHGQFVSCVAHLTNDWKKEGLISGREKGAIQSCTAQSDIP